MNVLSEILMNELRKLQISNLTPMCPADGPAVSNMDTDGCRNQCSGSCEGDCEGSCDSSCYGGCAGTFGYE